MYFFIKEYKDFYFSIKILTTRKHLYRHKFNENLINKFLAFCLITKKSNKKIFKDFTTIVTKSRY